MLQIGRHPDRHLLLVRTVHCRIAEAPNSFWNDISVISDRFVWRYPRESVHDPITEAWYACQPLLQHTRSCHFTGAYRSDSLMTACSSGSRSSCGQEGTQAGHSLMISESSSRSADLRFGRERM
jgi:hypothetical protein